MLQEINDKTIPIKWIIITEIEYTPSKTSINHQPNKNWETDTITTSAELNLKADNEHLHFYVKATTKCDAIQEALREIRFQELIYNSNLTFNDLNMENPEYSTPEGETGNFTKLDDFYMNMHSEIHILFKEDILNELYNKAEELIGVIIHP